MKEEGLNVNVSFKSVKLYDQMKSQTSSFKVTNALEEFGVVYKLRCQKCFERNMIVEYVGETGRKLGVRFGEHCRITRNRGLMSEVGGHMLEVHGEIKKERWDIEVLERENNEVLRKMKEAIHISRIKPTLNVSKGVKIFGMNYMR